MCRDAVNLCLLSGAPVIVYVDVYESFTRLSIAFIRFRLHVTVTPMIRPSGGTMELGLPFMAFSFPHVK